MSRNDFRRAYLSIWGSRGRGQFRRPVDPIFRGWSSLTVFCYDCDRSSRGLDRLSFGSNQMTGIGFNSYRLHFSKLS